MRGSRKSYLLQGRAATLVAAFQVGPPDAPWLSSARRPRRYPACFRRRICETRTETACERGRTAQVRMDDMNYGENMTFTIGTALRRTSRALALAATTTLV